MSEYEDGSVTGQEWALGFQQGMYLCGLTIARILTNLFLGAKPVFDSVIFFSSALLI
jgi:hypothetical protein